MSSGADQAPRVLAVDDELGYRELLAFELGSFGFSVETAALADEALGKIKTGRFDVVVTDLTMPKQTGLDALRAIKGVDPTLEVIIVTGHGTLESAVQSMKHGAFDFLAKPFELDHLRRRIEDAVAQRRRGKSSNDVKRWADFFERSAAGVCIASGDGLVHGANRAFLELLNYPAAECLGRPVAAFHADQQAVAEILAALGAARELKDRPVRLKAKSGQIKHALLTTHAFRRQGSLAYALCYTTPINEQAYRQPASMEDVS